MLEKMRRYWNTVPTKRIDIGSWYPVVCNLIYTVNQSPSAKRHFRESHPDLLCLQPIRSIRERNRRSQARTWLSNQEKHYKLVQSTFCRLGYPTLEDVCEAHGGFVVDDSPTDNENRCFEVLEGLIGTLYDGFFIQDTVPARKVIRNIRAVYHGMATLHKVRKGKTNNRGLLIRYEVGEIYLKESIFTVGGFFDAVATYVHESCHAFGGDTSESFSSALTYAMELLLGQLLGLEFDCTVDAEHHVIARNGDIMQKLIETHGGYTGEAITDRVLGKRTTASGVSEAAPAVVSLTVRTTESCSASIRCFMLRPPSRNPSRKARTTSSSTMPASISSEILRVLLLGEYISASLR